MPAPVHNPVAMTIRLRSAFSLFFLAAACSHSSSGGTTVAPPVAAAITTTGPVGPSSGIKVGRCTGIEGLAETKAAGFDYAELGTRNVAKLTDEEFGKALETHKQVGLPT